MNCQSHLEATAQFRMPTLEDETIVPTEAVQVEVRTRDGLLGGVSVSPIAAAQDATLLAAASEAPFRVEVE